MRLTTTLTTLLAVLPASLAAPVLEPRAAPVASAAPILKPRGVASTLSIDWGKAGNIYLSTKDYDCGPYPMTLYGRSPPFAVDAVASPTNQTLIESLGGGWPAGNLSFVVDLAKGTEFVMKITDADGNVAFSEEKVVKDGASGKWLCNPTASGKKKEDLAIMAIWLGCFSPFILLIVYLFILDPIYCLIRLLCRPCVAARCRRRADKAGKPPATGVAQPAIPLRPVVRPAPALVRTESAAPSYNSGPPDAPTPPPYIATMWRKYGRQDLEAAEGR
ncbi:hypothetical protein JCM10213_004547 [Rhodosporidiobolus nylandii]